MNKNKNGEIINENIIKNIMQQKSYKIIKLLIIVIKKVIDDSDNVFLRFNKYQTKNKITFCPCII